MSSPVEATHPPRASRPSHKAPLRGVHFAALAALIATPGVAIGRLLPDKHGWLLAGLLAASSLITYALYASDKGRAQRGEWRIPEKILHLWELLGGWPGGFLAQRRLRHKSAKVSYLATFWFIVVFHHYIAIDALLGWRLFGHARAWLTALS